MTSPIYVWCVFEFACVFSNICSSNSNCWNNIRRLVEKKGYCLLHRLPVYTSFCLTLSFHVTFLYFLPNVFSPSLTFISFHYSSFFSLPLYSTGISPFFTPHSYYTFPLTSHCPSSTAHIFDRKGLHWGANAGHSTLDKLHLSTRCNFHTRHWQMFEWVIYLH